MKYIIEVRRPFNVNEEEFATALTQFIELMQTINQSSFEVYDTATQRYKTLVENSANPLYRCMEVEPFCGIDRSKFLACDADSENDAYYVSIKIPDDSTEEMCEGRGVFLPRILREGNFFTWGDEPNPPRVACITALDYVKKGGL